MKNEPAVLALASNLCSRKVAWDFQNAFETAVSYLELMVAPAFGDDRVTANAANDQLVVSYNHFDVLWLDSSQVELDFPSFRATVNVGRGLP